MKIKHRSPDNPAVAGARVLVVDDHAPARESMIETLRHAGYQADACRAAPEALDRLTTESYDVVITDLRMPGMSGLEFIRALQHRPHGAQILMVTAHATVASAVEAMRHGAFDYIEKPFDADQLEQLVARALEHGHVLDQRSPVRSAGQQPMAMIGSSAVMQSLRTRIAQVAPTRETVLITGESGTGKELVARWLHAASDRRESPLVSLNCPALSSHLMESELFGHERGAFTGAENARTGRFELADKGTILLDEVTEIELSLQAKLLRVLQERSFERVGSSQTILVDVRVLATTNRDLPAEVAVGRFRADLFYRLNVVPLAVPPLRDRPEDLPELVTYFLGQTAQRLQKEACTLRRDAQELLLEYHWPGNVRELENIITRASVLATGPAIGADELRPWLIQAGETRSSGSDSTESMGLRLEDMERKMIEATLDRYAGHRAKTAEALGIGLRTLSGKLKGYGYAPRAKSMAKAG
ncbi:MAG TPA: sigma-54 dependent transcriptional regulator [Pirellulales bacterium]|jgi:DNA-binding NtrC family response regulator|nr:sigma-54 dependent transcriptional regulator [Pirellulales bacterium]